ncbi:MAG: ABC transporter permease [Gemmatimonadetes bacterium]|nr:ABC transporter permease [Gemmatimonadota bacterium]
MLRDPRSKRMVFVAPIVQLVLFGYAVNTDVRHTRTIVLDRDRTAESRALLDAFTASGYFRIAGQAGRSADLVAALDHGDAVVAVEVPRGFAADLAAGRRASVQLLVDGTSANTANVAHGYATQIVAQYAAARMPGGPAGVDLRARAWYNPNLESRVYNVPGVIGTIVMMMGLLLTSLAVVREREIGTLEQLMVSPLTPAELILGKTLPVVAVAFVDLVLITGVALLWFGIPMRGSFAFLLLASLTYILSGLGLGLLISTVSSTQQEAFMAMFFFFLPAIILSGFMYPVENMPTLFQYLTLLNPIRHYLVIVRGVFLKGAGFAVLWPEIAVLLAMGLVVLSVATSRFRKTAA